jgi:hypothetical protein
MDILKAVLGLGMSAQVYSLEMTVLSSWKKAYILSLEMSGSEEGGGEGRVETESIETVKEAPPPHSFGILVTQIE